MKTVRSLAILASGCLLATSAPSLAISNVSLEPATKTTLDQNTTRTVTVIEKMKNGQTANLARTCDDPVWKMSGWQALTCLYLHLK
jgi:hypothetical protein